MTDFSTLKMWSNTRSVGGDKHTHISEIFVCQKFFWMFTLSWLIILSILLTRPPPLGWGCSQPKVVKSLNPFTFSVLLVVVPMNRERRAGRVKSPTTSFADNEVAPTKPLNSEMSLQGAAAYCHDSSLSWTGRAAR